MIVEYFNHTFKEPQTTKANFYVVRPAETYATIAKKLEIDEEQLRSKNNNETLFLGKKIQIM